MQVFVISSIVSKIIKGEKENKPKTKVIDLQEHTNPSDSTLKCGYERVFNECRQNKVLAVIHVQTIQ